ncbi:amidohydrolase family protein [Dyadobacter psychrophilus]|uniref:2,3-dihydroxybenzoate decarboxylase n=1 Tax=Dyadobacter psychrophilus TaxID=651661 RepID=A0A1T5E3U5_9BACT|nr:amidohydrolase family protein [Dyadobacter psychrophilus]SKB78443.1 2,3-dihydroxybenzoate decarboxylase [Dyadobacter psychrophilus]
MCARKTSPFNDNKMNTPVNRRTALAQLSAFAGVASWPGSIAQPEPDNAMQPVAKKAVRKIATEEAFMIPEVAAAIRDLVRKGGSNLDFKLLTSVFDSPAVAEDPSKTPPPVSNRDASARLLLPKLLDLDEGRIAHMDATGVDMHLLSMSLPGVQLFEADQAVSLASLSNDRLSEAIRRHPTRFAGLACFAPQNPQQAAREMERSIKTLKLNGFLVNSHTGNGYLDEQRFWPILEAAEALGAPLYIHPRAPSDGMAAPFQDYRLEGAIWGYGIEAGTHAVRLMLSGVLDRFPKLQIVLGHMGEALPFWLWRLDFMGAPGARAGRGNQLKPSEYFKRNFSITTSGVEDPLVLRFCIDKLGIDSVMWAIDYPFQPSGPAVAFMDSAPLTDEERAKVAHGNAERIFRIAT